MIIKIIYETAISCKKKKKKKKKKKTINKKKKKKKKIMIPYSHINLDSENINVL